MKVLMKTVTPQKLTQLLRKRALLVGLVAIAVVVSSLLQYDDLHGRNHQVEDTAETAETGYHQTEDELRDYKHQVTVLLTADGPQPQTLRIPNDTRINWQNQDDKPHTLAISPGTTIPRQFYQNRTVATAGGYPFVIHQASTFHYYDVANPTLTGTVIVTAK
jgi:hypothetical protein